MHRDGRLPAQSPAGVADVHLQVAQQTLRDGANQRAADAFGLRIEDVFLRDDAP